MKTVKPVLFLLLFAMSACSAPKATFLSRPENIGSNPHGAFLIITNKENTKLSGELIAVDSGRCILLQQEWPGKIVYAPLKDIKSFKLYYAQTPGYGWTIPVGVLFPFIPVPDPDGGDLMPLHGYYVFSSVPVNLITTIAATVSGNAAYRYSERELRQKDLKMFARFPQGIPDHFRRMFMR